MFNNIIMIYFSGTGSSPLFNVYSVTDIDVSIDTYHIYTPIHTCNAFGVDATAGFIEQMNGSF